ncbi:MAG: 5'-methylthioadenosine/S-adenosylhomocysteine nucleosidase [Rickettsiales bacterium]|jgi:adenosylhomocysteine nucleosidase|nr:5'-methylthioadenosine/S-adenosylhomocysteine nucleosidase [Rickettsiales bacterium]
MKIAILVAVREEFNPNNTELRTDDKVFYTGVGKINAAAATQKAIDVFAPDLILNFGTAGSAKFNYGTIVNPTGFVQRDMNPTEFLAPKYITPLSSDTDPVLKYGTRVPDYPECITGTGDSFVNNIAGEIWDIVGMEDYAVAHVARDNKIPFACLRFISDGADSNAPEQWERVLDSANIALIEAYKKICKFVR